MSESWVLEQLRAAGVEMHSYGFRSGVVNEERRQEDIGILKMLLVDGLAQ